MNQLSQDQQGTELAYSHKGLEMLGTLFEPLKRKEPGPAVMVVHEWAGINAYSLSRASMLSKLGYTALAVDMYGGGQQAKDSQEAAELMGALKKDPVLMRGRIQAAMEALAEQDSVEETRLACMGYCFGGMVSLELARSGSPIKAAVSFHGGLETELPAQAGLVKASILVCHGAEDSWTAGGIEGFKEEMSRAGADWELEIYPGAAHSFTDPSAGEDPSTGRAYHPEADKKSWQRLLGFLSQHLGQD